MPEAAIYCRVAHIRDRDQTGVDAQEAWCRQLAGLLGLPVAGRHVYVDNHSSSWLRDRRRAGWEAMLAAAGGFRHLLVYRLERLLRQPWDLAELLAVADRCGIGLHGLSGKRDLGDPETRALFRAEVTRACQAAGEVSRAARAAHKQAAASGRPHGGGRRAYGYTAGMGALVEAEAAVVREIFCRFLAGETLRGIAADLNSRAVPAAYGGNWPAGGVARLLDAPRYAGLRVFRGEIARAADGGYLMGSWPPCVGVAEWEQARAARRNRAASRQADRRPARRYLLRGLVVCARCDRHMVGSMIGTYPFYACTSNGLLRPDRCTRHIAAERLEAFIAGEAAGILEHMPAAGPAAAPVAVPGVPGSTGQDVPRLDQLTEMRRTGRITAAEHDAQRAQLVKRIRAAQRAIVIRPMDALDGVITGPGARFAWNGLTLQRKAAVLRYLFAAIRIGPSTTSRGVFDYGRIHIVPNPR